MHFNEIELFLSNRLKTYSPTTGYPPPSMFFFFIITRLHNINFNEIERFRRPMKITIGGLMMASIIVEVNYVTGLTIR